MASEAFGEFVDTYGSTVAVFRHEGDRISLACKNDHPQFRGHFPSPHMSVKNVERMIGILLRFVTEVAPDLDWREAGNADVGATSRGFATFGPVLSCDGHEVRVQESSAIGAMKIWLFWPDHETPVLDAGRAAALVRSLHGAIQDAVDPENWRNTPEYLDSWGAE
jgi:hypothetical protein